MLSYITCVMLFSCVVWHMLCYVIQHVIWHRLSYITYVILRYGMLYNMLYNIPYVILCYVIIPMLNVMF